MGSLTSRSCPHDLVSSLSVGLSRRKEVMASDADRDWECLIKLPWGGVRLLKRNWVPVVCEILDLETLAIKFVLLGLCFPSRDLRERSYHPNGLA